MREPFVLAAFVDGLMPGIRSLRPPVFAGILWGLLAWILIANEVPAAGEATGWLSQVYAVMGSIGSAGLAVVVSVAVFLIGVAALALTEPLTSMVGRSGREFAALAQWQRHARIRRKHFKKIKVDALEVLESTTEESGYSVRRREAAEANLAEAEQAEKYFGGRANPRRLYTPRSKKARQVIGEPPLSAFESESAVVQQLIVDALYDAMYADQKAPDDYFRFFVDESGHPKIAERLHKELGSDPLEVVRVLDEGLYSDLDRERGERLVRLAVSTPMVALGVFIGTTIEPWIGVVIAAAGTILLVRHSTVQSGERSRILNLLILNNRHTQAMKAAVREGQLRYAALRREYDRDIEREAEREQRAAEFAAQGQQEPKTP